MTESQISGRLEKSWRSKNFLCIYGEFGRFKVLMGAMYNRKDRVPFRSVSGFDRLRS